MRIAHLLLVLPLLAVAPLGCDSDDGDDEHSDSESHGDHDGTHDSDTHEGETHDSETGGVDCSMEDRADDYAVGLSKTGTTVSVTFVSADPAPPALDDNSWVVSVTDLGGAPIEGAEVTVTPRMPDHGHGTPVVAEVTAGTNAGEYMINPVNMFMAGLWEVTMTLDGEGLADEVVFSFCVE